ncbi:MAG: hypothetical protein GXP25_14390 [Planctomycetes bacterium]|nr:hypothetical protein [Planctomycetota bacterium]
MGDEWNPRAKLLKCLVESVPETLKTQDKATGRFGSKPWICRDQQVLFTLAAAWATKDASNPYYHSAEVLDAIMKGGDYLIEQQDEKGMWTFRKKDNSTWGQIYMPWTYSRWIRTFYLIKDAMPPDRRERWAKALRHGYEGISKTCLGGVHNIPTHHAMGLYFAGLCFDRDDWKKQAAEFMAKVVAKQDPAGWWSEHYGPVVAYNFVYSDALGTYYAVSHDESVLNALRRAAVFHAALVYPDGARVETVDERNWYHGDRRLGNVGFSFTPEGRGYLLQQFDLAKWRVSPDDAASFLLYGGTGEAAPTAGEADERLTILGKNDALILRKKPWFICLSAYACEPIPNRWIQDRQNFVSIYHDKVGLIVGGGNTKLQPFWSNFTVGDTSLLRHTPGDEKPDFKPKGDLIHYPSSITLRPDKAAPELDMRYGEEDCRVAIQAKTDKELTIIYEATANSGKPVEGHLTFIPHLNGNVTCASGKSIKLGKEDFDWSAAEMGEWVAHCGWRVSVPAGAQLVWPKKLHNPYKKDGSSSLKDARMVLCLPFSNAAMKYEIQLEIMK